MALKISEGPQDLALPYIKYGFSYYPASTNQHPLATMVKWGPGTQEKTVS
jgi:hypothetical protein